MRTKQELIDDLYYILNSETSIKNHVERIYEIRTQLTPLQTDKEIQEISNLVKSKVQAEAAIAIQRNNGWGLILMATGTGKSKIVIDRVQEKKNIYLIVPTERLRDNNWKAEFELWNKNLIYQEDVKVICYASLHTIIGQEIDEVYLDEAHNLTEAKEELFFKNNTIHSCVALTATKPDSKLKNEMLTRLGLHVIYEITVDEAVKLGLISPYEIIIIKMKLNDTDKDVVAGNKVVKFLQTERQAYGYLSRVAFEAPSKRIFLKRMHFLYNLKSKTEVAKLILKNVIPQNIRTLIFCGSKKQANEVCEFRYYSKPTKPKKFRGEASTEVINKELHKLLKYSTEIREYQGDVSFKAFAEGIINRLACCEALNEGHNIDNLECGFMIQIDSTSLSLSQRIGRIIRFRPNFIGKIIILTVEGTVDEEWTMSAVKDLNPINVRIISLTDLRESRETILFTK